MADTAMLPKAKWILAALLGALIVSVSQLGRAETMGSDVYAIGPGKLPHSRAILSVTQATEDLEVCACVGGWAQNWGDQNNEFLKVFPALGVYNEGADLPNGTGRQSHVRVCPTMQVGKDADGNVTPDLMARSFTMPPAAETIAAGDWIAVEVDVQGVGVLHGAGELWNKAVVAPAGQCPR